jgi:hypothetical protein
VHVQLAVLLLLLLLLVPCSATISLGLQPMSFDGLQCLVACTAGCWAQLGQHRCSAILQAISAHCSVMYRALQVVGRILGTIVGACLGLAITHIPGIFGQPVLLLACIAAAAVPLSMLAKAEARTGVALAVLTLLAVALCAYELACCVPGAHLMDPMTVFFARLGSVSLLFFAAAAAAAAYEQHPMLN